MAGLVNVRKQPVDVVVVAAATHTNNKRGAREKTWTILKGRITGGVLGVFWPF